MNGAKAKNVYWKIEGAASINDYSIFCGTIICNNGALAALSTGVILNGKAFTTTGAYTTSAVTTTMAPVCIPAGIATIDSNFKNYVTIYPNPFKNQLSISLNSQQINKCELRMYTILGAEVLSKTITGQTFTLQTGNLSEGIYLYKVIYNDKIIQSGKLVSQ